VYNTLDAFPSGKGVSMGHQVIDPSRTVIGVSSHPPPIPLTSGH